MKTQESIIRISNVLNLTRQEFTTTEKHIFLNTLLQLKSIQGFNVPLDKEIIEVKIHSGLLKETNKQRIREAIDKITSRKIHFDRPLEDKFGYVVPIPFAMYEKGTITLQIMPIIKKLFLELANGYTEADLKAILNLTSIYAIRLYELLSQYSNKKKWTVSVEHLRELLNITNKYNDFRQFRLHILEYCQKELAEHCDLYFTWEVSGKQRKKITELTFYIRNKEQQEKTELNEEIRYTIDFVKQLSPSEIAQKFYMASTRYTLTTKQLDYVLSQPNLFNEFIRVDLIIEDMIAKGKPPKDRTKYLAKSLGLDKVKL